MESIEWSLITLGEFLHSSPNDWNDYQHAKQEALQAYFIISDHIKSPHPTLPQPEKNCPEPEFFEDSFGLVAGTLPASKLSAHDQVTRDEFDQEAM